MNYENKNKDYYQNVRLDLLSLLTFNKKYKVLEVGAGHGETLIYLKEKEIAHEVVGIDIVESKDNSNIDRFIFQDIENVNLSEYKNYFDVIILADVLEHLVEPQRILEKIKEYLKDDGEVLISIPNIRNIKAIYKVFFKGDFSYEERGIFDYTHLRFFCKRNIKQLVIDSGFRIETIVSSFNRSDGKLFLKLINRITFRIFEEFLTVQYLVKAKH